MAKRWAQDLGEMLEQEAPVPLLDHLTGRTDPDGLAEHKTSPTVVDFTFRLPPTILNEIREMAREQGCTVNAMMAGLVDLGLKELGRPAITADDHAEYIAYLRRGRRDAA